MKTQTYPNLLVLSVDINDLDENQIKEILLADWFEPNNKRLRNVILIDVSQLSDEDANLMDCPADYGINNPENNTKINDCLKRWNMEDGFYHA